MLDNINDLEIDNVDNLEQDIFDDQNAWPQQFEYIMNVCMKMKKAFRKYI